MSTKSLGTLVYVRRVVDDFPSAFAFYRRFTAPDGTAADEKYVEYGRVKLWKCDAAERLEIELVARDRFAQILGNVRQPEDGTLVFAVDDVDAAVEELRRAGAEIVVEPHEHEEWNTRFAQARDPTGRLVEVSVTRGSWGWLTEAS
ncbi:MAG: VOC family protein [Actinomycetota bacterium]|nr:VOC family protein [Actinomycetota bacterium]